MLILIVIAFVISTIITGFFAVRRFVRRLEAENLLDTNPKTTYAELINKLHPGSSKDERNKLIAGMNKDPNDLFIETVKEN